ncbi:MAG: zinc-ribbon domain-containing protein [Candidatus Lokiarchaeota archaeon]|nr:zinc-ribbon domain-containing protein [Candidatus Lokiarchaeota archaeon]
MSSHFACSRCKERCAIIKALIKSYTVVVKAKCPNGHGNKFFLQYNNRDQWLDDMRISLHQCICGEELKREQSLPRGHYVLLLLNCPVHGTRKHFVSTPIWNDMQSVSMAQPKMSKPEYPREDYGPEVVVPPVEQSGSQESQNMDSKWDTEFASPEVDNNIPQGEIRYCPSCGEEITPGSFFCTNCGEEIK